MKKQLGFGIVILLCLIGIFVFNFSFAKSDLKLNPIEMKKSNMGILNEKLTFKNVMKTTNEVLVGRVIGLDELNESRKVYNVAVEDDILGETQNEVLVYVGEELLEQGSKYVFFLQPLSSTVYEKDFYVQHPEFIIKIGDNGELSRLANAYEFTYEKPFTDEKYNQLSTLKSFIKKNFKQNVSENQSVIQYKNKEQLLQQSDLVMEILINEIDDDRGISIVHFVVLKKYKGDKDDFDILLPTNQIKQGNKYLIFLKENEDGSPTLTTRNGSLIEVGTSQYNDTIKLINK
ncbi:hypothetical protein ACQKP0_24035 [Heyndrickxia sp. NPDC080065]|uniref:hypothetical protein n=1 Tax=Heyndrickxia sp. NPDC080065 TaxID=3390568 RepID=UPI003CFEC3B4